MYCRFCKAKLPTRRKKSYCNNLCQAGLQYTQWLISWSNGEQSGHSGKTLKVSNHIRKYLFAKANNKCQKCGWAEIHSKTKTVPLEVNHINGDASDCREENLELICPNCHSLTENFRNLNKHSKRKRN